MSNKQRPAADEDAEAIGAMRKILDDACNAQRPYMVCVENAEGDLEIFMDNGDTRAISAMILTVCDDHPSVSQAIMLSLVKKIENKVNKIVGS